VAHPDDIEFFCAGAVLMLHELFDGIGRIETAIGRPRDRDVVLLRVFGHAANVLRQIDERLVLDARA